MTITAPRRLLLVSYDSTISTANLALRYLAESLIARDWAVRFAVRNDGPIANFLRRSGAEVVIEPLLFASEDSTLRSLCRNHDVVIANTLLASEAIRVASEERTPAVWWLHETDRAKSIIDASPEIRSCFTLPDLVVVPNDSAARMYCALTEQEIEIVPYGIPANDRPVSRAGSVVRFVVLGSFERRRGQDALMQAISALPDATSQQASFIFAGRNLDTSFVAGLREQSVRFPNVELRDAVTHREALSLIDEADVVIAPAREAQMPLTVLEAMSRAKPVITTRSGGFDEWLHDELNALIVPTNDPTELARAFERCVYDRAFAGEIGTTGRRTFDRHFTLEQFGSRFANVLGELTRRRGSAAAPHHTYSDWLALYGETESSRVALRRRVRGLIRQPLISVLLPVYNPDVELLRAAIRSVQEQVYQRWELCIADDASTHTAVRPLLEQIAAVEPRIRLVFRPENGHIAAASTSALAVATGDWCALLDQDDVLSGEALAAVACAIQEHPHAGLFYSDEDKINEAGEHADPYFKSDWNPELFLAQNFINHLGVYRADLVRDVGGFREGYEGSQDYDLALRIIDRVAPEQIRHIPRVLYHWRMASGSVAAVAGAKPYATTAARRAIADHLARTNTSARVESCPENSEAHRVVYDLPAPTPLVSVIIPTRNGLELLERCVDGLRHHTAYSPLEIVIVDNGSTDAATLKFLDDVDRNDIARVLRDDEPFNFSRLMNRGAAAATGELLLLLNNDIEVEHEDWLREMVSHAVRPQTGVVGARLWYPNGTIQHGGVIIGLGGVAGHASFRVPRGAPGYFGRAILQQNVSAVTAACLLVRKSVFEEVGGFDAANLGINFNDVDFCLKVRRAGYRNVWTPYASLIHHESASRGHNAAVEEQAQFLREANFMQQKWTDELLRDPYYNPNLSLNWPGFELAFPPRLTS